jgi:hypothetical protein
VSSPPAETFGKSALGTKSTAELLELEERGGRAERFRKTDQLLGQLVVRALRGARAATAYHDEKQLVVELEAIDATQRQILDAEFALTVQQKRGAWFLPEDARVRVGIVNFPSYLKAHPQYATGIALEEAGRVDLTQSSDGIFLWAVLEPLFAEFFRPFELRGPESATLNRAESVQQWAAFDQFCSDMGIDVARALSLFRFGGGWGKLNRDQQVAAKQNLMEALSSATKVTIGARYRALSVRALLEKYYSKAKDGRAKRRQVVTKQLGPILAGFFGGDWLAFLDYIGEQPHSEEKVTTTLPESKLYVGGESRIAEAAVKSGIPPEEVQRILAAYWANSGGSSPVHRRSTVLGHYWKAFDEIHARQKSGMRSLWGLVEEGGFINLDDVWRTPYQAGLFRELLPADLLRDIEELWGGTMISKWPDRVVSEPYPHAAMADALGPALSFWQGCALTAWFICEGPSSRTDIDGLATYHSRHLDELAALGCPIDVSLFVDLKAAEKHLGPPQPIVGTRHTHSIGGLSFTMQMNQGERRDGFEWLRDVITRHRRAWSTQYFEGYLRTLWEGELRRASYDYNVLAEEKSKPPTLKQFAKHAVASANHWFGGDVTQVYGALGVKAPPRSERLIVMPSDRVTFAWAVFSALGGKPFRRESVVANRAEGERQAEEQQRNHGLKRLAEESLWYLQLEEALGRPPDVKEFGQKKFEGLAVALSGDPLAAWAVYSSAVVQVKQTPTPSPSQTVTTAVASPLTSLPAESSNVHSAPIKEPAEELAPTKRGWFSRLFGR